jgi:hypothetical protein
MYSIVLPRNAPDHNISCICDIPINTILVQNMLLTRPNPTERHDCFDQDLEIQGPLSQRIKTNIADVSMKDRRIQAPTSIVYVHTEVVTGGFLHDVGEDRLFIPSKITILLIKIKILR